MAPRRRRGVEQPRSIVAAAKRIDLDAKTKITPREGWQNDAWLYFDEVPEVKELILWRGNQLAKVKLFVATLPLDAGPDASPVNVLDPDSGIPPDVARLASERLARVKARVGGQPGIVQRLELNLEVVGECWVVKLGERAPNPADEKDMGRDEEWLVASVDEVEAKTQGDKTQWKVKRNADDKEAIVLDKEQGDDIFRVWQPHARYFEKADCAMRGIVGECETLTILANQVKAEGRSRAAAGIFTVPNELSFAGQQQNVEQPDADGQDTQADPFLDELVEALTSPAADPSHPNSVVPLLLRGPKDAMTPDVLRKIDLSRSTDASLDDRIEKRVMRIARGLNGPVEVVLGHQSTTFANAKQIDQDIFEDYIEPRVLFDCDAFTVGFLRPDLDEAGIDGELVDRMFVWFDASDLIASPDTEANANDAWDRNLITDSEWRQQKGYGEDAAPEPIEVLNRIAARRGIFTADLTAALMAALADEAGVELPSPPESLDPNAGVPPVDEEAGRQRELAVLLAQALMLRNATAPGAAAAPAGLARRSGASRGRNEAGRRAGRQLAGIDADLRTRLLVASNDAMNRALERAGNRLKSKAGQTRATLRNTPSILCAAQLGPSLVAQAGFTEGELLEGAFDALEETYKAWGATAQRQAIDVAYRLVGGFTKGERDRLGLRMAESLDEAWSWMEEALTSLAEAKLYDPAATITALGEFDPTLKVPPGLVRQSIARAGGAVGLQTTGQGDAWITLTQGGTRPAGGIGTGELIGEVLRDNGAGVEGWVWDYGMASRLRPFEPHVQLDGVEFENFDDPVLANNDSFPEFAFYMPGDHSGCMCDAVPVILTSEGAKRVVDEYEPED